MHSLIPPVAWGTTLMLAGGLLAGCGGGDELNVRPHYIRGEIRTTTYDGTSDDLLTAGLGKTGLASATPPTYADPAAPTAAELRRHAIYVNYRALVDMTANGGYGVFYGPNVSTAGVPEAGEGKIAGTETIAYSDDGSGRRNVTLMVQIPDGFDPDNPCIVTATSSGSRGVYGAISVGEWGLKRRCAVAYTDKGTGSAPHDLATDTVALIDGTRTTSAAADKAALFDAGLNPAKLAAFNAAYPNRLAFKHAHSQRNPEKDWGKFTLQAIEFAFYVLNERYGERAFSGIRLQKLVPANTLVIASSVSNGAASSLAAAELDTLGLIDGISISEPALQMPAAPVVQVRRGATMQPVARPLADYLTYTNLYQLCATQSAQLAGAPALSLVPAATAANRCASLHAKGLLAGTTLAEQADEAWQKLREHGYEAESGPLQASHAALEIPASVGVTYANAYTRSSVEDNLCNFSFASVNSSGAVVPMPANTLAQSFATGNGVPPSTGSTLINNTSVGGPLRSILSVSASTGVMDANLDGALCVRGLWTGADATARAFQRGVDEARRNGNLRGKPALIVHGRADAHIVVNHNSRPYTALNKTVEGSASKLSYVEVENAQHFDAFIQALPGFDTRFVPLHLYLIRANDAMWAHLKNGTPLPGSQVVRTVPRGGSAGSAPALAPGNVPGIASTPAPADSISFVSGVLNIPD